MLIEATLLGLLGGAAGAAAALAVLAFASVVLPVPLSVSPAFLALTVAAAGGSGIAAGWYPAIRANRLNVIEALRSE